MAEIQSYSTAEAENPSSSSAVESVTVNMAGIQSYSTAEAENPSSSSAVESVTVNMAGIQSSFTVDVAIPSSSSVMESVNIAETQSYSPAFCNTSDLYKAARRGDWVKTEKILQENPTLRVAPLNSEDENVLHVLVGTGKAIHYLQKLVKHMPPKEFERTNEYGHTPLIACIVIGNIDAVNLLVIKNSRLLYIKDKEELLPVHKAAQYGKKDILLFLLKVTSANDPNPYGKESGAKLLAYIIEAGFYDVATSFIQRFHHLIFGSYSGGHSYATTLTMMATNPSAFKVTGLWKNLLYNYIPANWQISYDNCPMGLTARSDEVQLEQLMDRSRIARYITFAKPVRDQAKKLVNILCENALGDKHLNLETLKEVFFLAAENGIVEIVEKLADTFPQLLWSENVDGHNILHIAVLCRHRSVYNLIHRISKYKFYEIRAPDHQGNNLLHMAAKLPPQDRLSNISGAALKFKFELLWFETVKRSLQPFQRNARNIENKTPEEIFTEEHKELFKEGAEWIKTTASSCVTPAALIASVASASAISVPSSTKIVDFKGENYLTLFAWANAFSLLTSMISLLISLSTLVFRNTPAEFLGALLRLIEAAVCTLLVSSLSMVWAFTNLFNVTLGSQLNWILLTVLVASLLPFVIMFLRRYLLGDIYSSRRSLALLLVPFQ